MARDLTSRPVFKPLISQPFPPRRFRWVVMLYRPSAEACRAAPRLRQSQDFLFACRALPRTYTHARCAHIHAHSPTHTYTNLCLCTHTHTPTHSRTHVRSHTRTHTHTHSCKYTNTPTHAHASRDTHTHAHIPWMTTMPQLSQA